MAAGSADKENVAPPTSGATAIASASAVDASRRHGYGVKSCGVKKRPCRPRLLGRVPLRDITNLMTGTISSSEASPSPAATTELTSPDAVLPAVVRVAAAAQEGGGGGEAAAPAAKAARYSLWKGYR